MAPHSTMLGGTSRSGTGTSSPGHTDENVACSPAKSPPRMTPEGVVTAEEDTATAEGGDIMASIDDRGAGMEVDIVIASGAQ